MFLQKEIIDSLSSPVYFTKYTIDSPNVRAWVYDYVEQKPIFELERTPNLTLSLGENQFSVDWKNNRIYFSSNLLGTPIYLEYYTNGEINPFYETSNLLKFVKQVLDWTNYKINSGLYFYKQAGDTSNILRLAHGSVIYNSNLYVVNEIVYDFRDYAPPTQPNLFKCYYFFINESVLETWLNPKTKTLTQIGLVISDMYEDKGYAKLDVLSKFKEKYKNDNSKVIDIAFVYTTYRHKDFDFYIEYPKEFRTLV